MNNMAFTYTTTPLEMAESMAFNRDCLGCVCWFEYGKIVAKPGSTNPISPALGPFIRFFHTRRDLLRESRVVADVAVLRSFPSQVFADSRYSKLTYDVEQALIDNRICFQIIYNQHLDDLKPYRVLILAGCVAISDEHIKQIENYLRSGGSLCIIGQVGTHDEWMHPRSKPVFGHLQDSKIIRIAEDGDILNAIRKACNNELTLSVQGGSGLCSELTEKTGKRLVHLVNYWPYSIKNIRVILRLPDGRHAKNVTLVSPERQDDRILTFEDKDGYFEFTVPEVSTYEIAVIIIK